MLNVKKLTFASMLIAVGVVCSAFYIPIGVAKCFPIQHMINLLAGVLLGPLYAVSMAFATSVIRVSMGTGSLLAFPGSMIGALLCGLFYKFSGKTTMAFLGEVIGTGFFGAIVGYYVASLFMDKSVAMFVYVIPFGISSLGGALISLVLLNALKRTNVFETLKFETKTS
ncbi:MAG: energy coupling factor transporter S component ThiW [Lachnospirales bacterium]